tara:strand:- start:1156 stop:1872 length:717 start_codon:yes stop_codon:yes gene_type:complete
MNFSILLNTRKRISYLENLISSVMFKTSSFENVEILINYDNDDEETNLFKSRIFYPNVKFFSGARPHSLHTTINKMARQSQGRFLIGVNDDIEFLTEGWDEIILDKVESFKSDRKIKDDVIYCKSSCTSVDHVDTLPYGSCPIVSLEAVKCIDKFLYEEFLGLGGDSSIYRVYAELDRVVDVSEVTFDHLMHNTLEKVYTPDQTGQEMRAKSFSQNLDPFTFDISKEVDILRKHIDNN